MDGLYSRHVHTITCPLVKLVSGGTFQGMILKKMCPKIVFHNGINEVSIDLVTKMHKTCDSQPTFFVFSFCAPTKIADTIHLTHLNKSIRTHAVGLLSCDWHTWQRCQIHLMMLFSTQTVLGITWAFVRTCLVCLTCVFSLGVFF